MRRINFILSLMGLFIPLTVLSCTLCHSERGQAIRAAIFDEHFWYYLAITCTPFIFFLFITFIIYFTWPQK